MSDKTYTLQTQSNVDYVSVVLPIELNAKKTLKTITIDLDEFEMVETGTKVKNNKPVQYYKFRLLD